MALALYFHPLSSSCHKVLIALYEMNVSFEGRVLNLGDAKERADFLALWPTGKMPLLLDDGRVIPETSVIIEHLAQHHAAAGQTLVPSDATVGLEVRLMDRLLDLYVMMQMQAIVADRLREEADRDPIAVDKARATLETAYGLLEDRLAGRTWAAGDEFSMADCTAAPALFYSTTLVPFTISHPRLTAYFERLVNRKSVARTLEEAKPFFQFYPYQVAIAARFR